VNPVQIRPAHASDAPLLLTLIRELADYEKLSADVTASAEMLAQTLFGDRPFAFALLAFAGETPAGFAVYYFGYSTFRARPILYVEDVFVRQAFRAQGIGRQLFACLLRSAREQGCSRVEWSVLDWNAPALHFYERLGAVELHEWRRYRLTAEQIPLVLQSLERLESTGESGDRLIN
jgi:GNAT superfamily N-acetyltransferase